MPAGWSAPPSWASCSTAWAGTVAAIAVALALAAWLAHGLHTASAIEPS